jgi:hypothetical protein
MSLLDKMLQLAAETGEPIEMTVSKSDYGAFHLEIIIDPDRRLRLKLLDPDVFRYPGMQDGAVIEKLDEYHLRD